MNKTILKVSQIEAEIYACPYCMGEVSQDDIGCCGESSAHFETAYVTQDDTYLESQVEIVPDLPIGVSIVGGAK